MLSSEPSTLSTVYPSEPPSKKTLSFPLLEPSTDPYKEPIYIPTSSPSVIQSTFTNIVLSTLPPYTSSLCLHHIQTL